MTFAALNSDLSEVGLVIIPCKTTNGYRWRVRPLRATVRGRMLSWPFRTVDDAAWWWRKRAATIALQVEVVRWMETFVANAPSHALDEAMLWTRWFRQVPLALQAEPPTGFAPHLVEGLKAVRSLEWEVRPYRTSFAVSGRGWRRRAIETWRAFQAQSGWAHGPIFMARLWAAERVEEAVAARLDALPPATGIPGQRRRL